MVPQSGAGGVSAAPTRGSGARGQFFPGADATGYGLPALRAFQTSSEGVSKVGPQGNRKEPVAKRRAPPSGDAPTLWCPNRYRSGLGRLYGTLPPGLKILILGVSKSNTDSVPFRRDAPDPIRRPSQVTDVGASLLEAMTPSSRYRP